MAGEKRFKPTLKRLKRARQEGRVLKSQFLTQLVVIYGTVFLTFWLLKASWVSDRLLVEYLFVEGIREPEQALRIWFRRVLSLGVVTSLISLVIATLVESAQAGVSLFFPRVAFKADRLNLASGLRKIGHGLQKAPILALRIIMVLLVVLVLLMREAFKLPEVVLAPVEEQLRYSVLIGIEFLIWSLALLSFLAFLDYTLERRRYLKDLLMSRDELVRDQKEDQGDPHMKSRRRALHEELITRELIRRVRKAKVIIVE